MPIGKSKRVWKNAKLVFDVLRLKLETTLFFVNFINVNRNLLIKLYIV